MSTLKKVCGSHHDHIDHYNVAASKFISDRVAAAPRQSIPSVTGLSFLLNFSIADHIQHIDMAGVL